MEKSVIDSVINLVITVLTLGVNKLIKKYLKRKKLEGISE